MKHKNEILQKSKSLAFVLLLILLVTSLFPF